MIDTNIKSVINRLRKRQKLVQRMNAVYDDIARKVLARLVSATPSRSGETCSLYKLDIEHRRDGNQYTIRNKNKKIIFWLEYGTPAHGPVTAEYMHWVEGFHPAHKGAWCMRWVRGIEPHGFVEASIEYLWDELSNVNRGIPSSLQGLLVHEAGALWRHP